MVEQALERPVPLHREKHPNLDVEGCFGCKAANVSFGGIRRLQAWRRDGVTEAEFKKAIYDGARRTGRDIRRVGGASPTSGPLLT